LTPFDLSGIENEDAWSSGMVLKPGRHTVKVVEVVERKSRNNHPEMVIRLEAIAGPQAGGSITDYQAVTANTLGRVKQMLPAAGMWREEADWSAFDPQAFLGKVVDCVVVEKPRQSEPGKTVSEVLSWAPATSSGGDVPGDTADLEPQSHPDDERIPF
jgi:hypothetical protein